MKLVRCAAVSVGFIGLLWALAGRAQGLPAAAPEAVGMSAQRLGEIAAVLKREIDEGNLPGAVVMVARKGKLVYSEAVGFQDAQKTRPMPRDAIFRLYSMTKPLASVAAMMLVEEGKVQLTDPVSKFLPALKQMQVSVAHTDAAFAKVTYTLESAEREMTVQDLLRHSAGLAYGQLTQNTPVRDAYTKARLYDPTGDYDLRDLSPSEFVDAVARSPLAHHPGTVWEYSIATDVLGRVVEAASGQRLGEFLSDRLFQPLGMKDSGFWVPKDQLARLAEPLPVDRPSGKSNKLIDVSAVPKNDSGGAGGVGTAADYLRFCQMLLNGGQLDGVRIVSRTTVSLMASEHLSTRIAAPFTPGEQLLGTPGYTFGLGFAVRQGPGVAGVPGSTGEFMWAGYGGTYFWIDPQEQLTAVYMSQAPSPMRAYYRKLIKQLVYAAIVD